MALRYTWSFTNLGKYKYKFEMKSQEFLGSDIAIMGPGLYTEVIPVEELPKVRAVIMEKRRIAVEAAAAAAENERRKPGGAIAKETRPRQVEGGREIDFEVYGSCCQAAVFSHERSAQGFIRHSS